MSQSIRQRRVLRQYVASQRQPTTATRPATGAWFRSVLEQLQQSFRARDAA